MRKVLITGGSRGIGAETVRVLTANGDLVAFFYRRDHAAAEAVSKETGAIAIAVDIADSAALVSAYRAACEALGGAPDILVNNAGIAESRLSRDVTDAEWHRMLDTNLTAAFLLCREAQVAMIGAGGGRIVNVGSMWGKVGASCEVAYSAAKAGLRGMTMALAKELGPSGITVNCVEPGVIDTDMNKEYDAATMAALADETPLSRIGTPRDVANVIAFLASDDASFVTGQCIGVDGGYAIG